MAFTALDELSLPSKIAVFTLCLSNLIFVALGTTCISIGAYYFNPESVLDFVAKYFVEVEREAVQKLLDVDSSQFLSSCCVMLIASGAGITIVSLFGLCGAISRNSHCMLGYAVFLVLLIVGQISGLVIAGLFRAKLDTNIQRYLTDVMISNYDSGMGTGSSLTVLMDYMQMQYDCCGINDATDFSLVGGAGNNWRRSFASNVTYLEFINIPLPVFCCKFDADRKLSWKEVVSFEEAAASMYHSELVQYLEPHVADTRCLREGSSVSSWSWANQGCYKSFQHRVFTSLYNLLVGIAASVVIIEGICLLGSCVLVCDIQSIETLDSKREEKIADINAERSTMLAGIQASGSLAALSIAGQLHQPGVQGSMSRLTRTQSGMMPSVRGHGSTVFRGGSFGQRPSAAAFNQSGVGSMSHSRMLPQRPL